MRAIRRSSEAMGRWNGQAWKVNIWTRRAVRRHRSRDAIWDKPLYTLTCEPREDGTIEFIETYHGR